MLGFIKDHPFAVASHLEVSLVVTYAVPKELLEKFIPECLSLDTFEERWAFITLALVKTRDLRPKGFPKFMGNDFILAGYRIFVKYNTSYGKRLRGLYIIKSETDKTKMALLGNIFTHYNYQSTDINFKEHNRKMEVYSAKSNFQIKVVEIDGEIGLPDQSPFKDWKEARRYAGPLPFTFSFDHKKNEVLIIEGVRKDWTPRPVEIVESNVGLIDSLKLNGAVLASAFVIRDIPYYWKKGIKDTWRQS